VAISAGRADPVLPDHLSLQDTLHFAGEVCTGAPLPVVTKGGDENRLAGGQGNEGSPQLLASELKIELEVRLAKAHSPAPKSPANPGDPMGDFPRLSSAPAACD
jgi:hypothetical protein